jgi:hypothetical protein
MRAFGLNDFENCHSGWLTSLYVYLYDIILFIFKSLSEIKKENKRKYKKLLSEEK